MVNIWAFVVISVIALIMGGVTDIYDKERTKSAFGLSTIFVTVMGIGYIMLVWLEYLYLLTD